MNKNNKPYLLTDVDGVLLDWIKSFGMFVESKGHKLKFETPKTWEMNEWFGGDDKLILDLVTEFNSSPAFAKIPAFSDAMKILPYLANHYKLVAITCCSKDSKIVQRRIENLQVLGVKFEDVHCLNFTDNKIDLLKSYDNTLWVEDRIKGAEEGRKAGHTTFLRRTTYNTDKTHKEIIRVNCWEEILKLVKNPKLKALSA